MQKKYKAALFAIACALAPAAASQFIFWRAQKKNTLKPDSFYQSPWGQIHYKVLGNGRPLLLIHSGTPGASHLEWERNTEALSKKYKLYLIDLLGYGFSSRPSITYTAYTQALVINAFLRDVIKKPVCVLATGAGASFALMAYRLEPKWYRKMLLIAPEGANPQIATNEDNRTRMLLELPYVGTLCYTILTSKSNIRKFLQNQAFFGQERLPLKELTDAYYYPAHFGGSANRYVMASYCAKFMNTDIRPVVKEASIPLHFIWGENARMNPVENMEILEELRPDFQYTLFEETRLMPQYENATAFHDLVIEYLK